MIRGIGETLSETVGSKSDQFRLRIDEIHFLLLRLLLLVVGSLLTTSEAAETTKATKTATSLGCVLLRLDAVQDALGLSLVVDARVVTPAVGGENESGNEIQLTIAGCTC